MNTNNEYIKFQLQMLLKKNNECFDFINDLSSCGDLLFFGGSIRDIFLSPGSLPMPRDFDIAIKDLNVKLFEQLITKYEKRTNRFGGYKFLVGGTEFDVWDLNNTWAFKNTNLKANVENLSQSVYLNIDGIVYDFSNDKLYDKPFQTSLSSKLFDINLELNPHVELNLLRAMVMKEKYKKEIKFNFSNRLKQVFKIYIAANPEVLINKLYDLQIKHYNIIYFSKKEIRTILNRV